MERISKTNGDEESGKRKTNGLSKPKNRETSSLGLLLYDELERDLGDEGDFNRTE